MKIMKSLTVCLFLLGVLVAGSQAQDFLSTMKVFKGFDWSKLVCKGNFPEVYEELITKSCEVISEENPKVSMPLMEKYEKFSLEHLAIMSDDSDGLTNLEKQDRADRELKPQRLALYADFMYLSRRAQLKLGRFFLDSLRKLLDDSLDNFHNILAEEDERLRVEIERIDQQEEVLKNRRYSGEL